MTHATIFTAQPSRFPQGLKSIQGRRRGGGVEIAASGEASAASAGSAESVGSHRGAGGAEAVARQVGTRSVLWLCFCSRKPNRAGSPFSVLLAGTIAVCLQAAGQPAGLLEVLPCPDVHDLSSMYLSEGGRISWEGWCAHGRGYRFAPPSSPHSGYAI